MYKQNKGLGAGPFYHQIFVQAGPAVCLCEVLAKLACQEIYPRLLNILKN